MMREEEGEQQQQRIAVLQRCFIKSLDQKQVHPDQWLAAIAATVRGWRTRGDHGPSGPWSQARHPGI